MWIIISDQHRRQASVTSVHRPPLRRWCDGRYRDGFHLPLHPEKERGRSRPSGCEDLCPTGHYQVIARYRPPCSHLQPALRPTVVPQVADAATILAVKVPSHARRCRTESFGSRSARTPDKTPSRIGGQVLVDLPTRHLSGRHRNGDCRLSWRPAADRLLRHRRCPRSDLATRLRTRHSDLRGLGDPSTGRQFSSVIFVQCPLRTRR